jgi:superfamily II DNA/RNA helicase
VHGDLNQEQRERAMAAFKAGTKDILIATDVAARGIDVDDVTHVINHTIPEDEKAYLHRVGRTGRAGKTGIAVTFVDWDDLHKWALINRALDFGQPEPTETYSSSPHLYADLNIPEGAKGRLRATPVKDAEPRAAHSGGSSAGTSGRNGNAGRADSGRTRSRTRVGRTTNPDAPEATPAAGTHDGGGAQHQDGNSAPRRRNRTRRRAPQAGSTGGAGGAA